MDNSFIKIHFHVVIKFWSVFDLLYEKIGRLNDVAFFWTFRFVNLKMSVYFLVASSWSEFPLHNVSDCSVSSFLF